MKLRRVCDSRSAAHFDVSASARIRQRENLAFRPVIMARQNMNVFEQIATFATNLGQPSGWQIDFGSNRVAARETFPIESDIPQWIGVAKQLFRFFQRFAIPRCARGQQIFGALSPFQIESRKQPDCVVLRPLPDGRFGISNRIRQVQTKFDQFAAPRTHFRRLDRANTVRQHDLCNQPVPVSQRHEFNALTRRRGQTGSES